MFLINPNGVLFGKDSRVDVNGLVASSLAISNADFLAGKNNFVAGANAGKVANAGAITTPGGGQVFLLAPEVENNGLVTAPNGEVVLAAGRSVQLVDSSNPDVRVLLAAPADRALNLGAIVASGGRVGIYGALVSQRGSINADTAVRGAQGQIILKASGSTLLEAGSSTSAVNAAGQGGHIELLGRQVGLNGNALVDASGAAGGGSVLVGGDYQGANAALQNAQQTFVAPAARIRADALAHGDGGKVVVWSDAATRMHGGISARGGAAGGNGGLVETSGHYLDVAGAKVDAGAPAGARGRWLLDPYDIEVVLANGSASLADVAVFGNPPSTGPSQVNAALLSAATADVVLQANHNITFSSAVTIVNAGTGLTALAGNDINVNAAISSAGGAITLRANDAGGSEHGTGALTINAGGAIATGGGNLNLSGNNVSILDALTLGGGVLAVTASEANGGIVVGSNGNISGVASATLLADNMTLGHGIDAGGPGGSGSVTLAPFTAGRAVTLGGKAGGTLGLESGELSGISSHTLTLGNGSAGAIASAANLGLDDLVDLNLISGAAITLNHNITLGDANATLGAVAGGGVLTVGGGAQLQAPTIALRADQMTLGGTLGAANVKLDTYASASVINIGNGAVDGTGVLGLSETELKTSSGANLAIGGYGGHYGALTVVGTLNLGESGGSAQSKLSLTGGSVAVNGAVTLQGALALHAVGEGGAVTQSAAINAASLSAVGAAVALNGNNTVGRVSGRSTEGPSSSRPAAP
ncbi:hypothetical protein [Rugamonas sp. DEMB1]|uniref:two-partner secretion domain-containing protein n=1 Tax=Rugamonas sp. DEMB1 TaxID=3039386 RepID=UPI002448301E|nr:hypothetical protein [Rugamonas sp. DEMB1]WGG51894.1 hypothetical protein QC826_06725 [Rugamonas sp. DEMB1]